MRNGKKSGHSDLQAVAHQLRGFSSRAAVLYATCRHGPLKRSYTLSGGPVDMAVSHEGYLMSPLQAWRYCMLLLA